MDDLANVVGLAVLVVFGLIALAFVWGCLWLLYQDRRERRTWTEKDDHAMHSWEKRQ